METIRCDGFYLPDALRDTPGGYVEQAHRSGSREVVIRAPELSKTFLEEIVTYLTEVSGPALKRRPIHEIVHVLDRAAELWLDPGYPPRQEALRAIPAVTGFSPAMVAECIDVEQRSSRKRDILRALGSELGEPEVLDRFRPRAATGGLGRAVGPRLLVALFSGNIPALPHLSIMRSLLVKAPCIGKPASGEPIYPALYARTLEEIDPEIARAVSILSWTGGDRDIEGPLFKAADAVVVWGSPQTCESVRARIPPGTRLVVHGHKLGFGVIAREALTAETVGKVAEAAAYDVAMFDQQACLAPHVYFVEAGGEIGPEEFARRLGSSLAEMEGRLPCGIVPVEARARLAQLRSVTEMRELAGEPVRLITEERGSWTVILEETRHFAASPLYRTIRVIPVDHLTDVIEILGPVSQHLQNCAAALSSERAGPFFDSLADLGVSRISSPGRMSTPSMMWRHDGRPCILDLVEWVDVEQWEPVGPAPSISGPPRDPKPDAVFEPSSTLDPKIRKR